MLGRRGQVVERHRVEALPFTIGRGYDNDLILDDRWVSPFHATIDRDEAGALWLRDAGSDNGIEQAGHGGVVAQVPLAESVRVELGHTTLRLRPSDHPVEPALALVRAHPIRTWLTSNPMAAVLVGSLLVAGSGYGDWQRAVYGLDSAELVRSLLAVLVVVAAWAGAWALVGRLLVHSARYTEHWIATACCAVASVFLDQLLVYFRFFFSDIAGVQRFDVIARAAILGCLLFWQLGIATGLVTRRRMSVAGLAAALWFGFGELDLQQETGGWLETLPYWSQLEPIDPDWLPTESPDAFFARSVDMRAWLGDVADELEALDAREAARRAAHVSEADEAP